MEKIENYQRFWLKKRVISQAVNCLQLEQSTPSLSRNFLANAKRNKIPYVDYLHGRTIGNCQSLCALIRLFTNRIIMYIVSQFYVIFYGYIIGQKKILFLLLKFLSPPDICLYLQS